MSKIQRINNLVLCWNVSARRGCDVTNVFSFDDTSLKVQKLWGRDRWSPSEMSSPFSELMIPETLQTTVSHIIYLCVKILARTIKVRSQFPNPILICCCQRIRNTFYAKIIRKQPCKYFAFAVLKCIFHM